MEIYTYTKSQQHSRTRQRVITPRLWRRYKRTQRIGYSEFGSKANPWLLMESHCVKTDHINMCTAPPTHSGIHTEQLNWLKPAERKLMRHATDQKWLHNVASWYGVEGWGRIEDVTDWQAGHISSFIIQKYEITHVHAHAASAYSRHDLTQRSMCLTGKDWIKGVLTS